VDGHTAAVTLLRTQAKHSDKLFTLSWWESIWGNHVFDVQIADFVGVRRGLAYPVLRRKQLVEGPEKRSFTVENIYNRLVRENPM
jgi:hypothetical protein